MPLACGFWFKLVFERMPELFRQVTRSFKAHLNSILMMKFLVVGWSPIVWVEV